MRRTVITLALGAILTVTGVASASCDPIESPSAGPPCTTVSAGPVRSDRRFSDHDLPGIGAYVEIHWLTRMQGDPCSRLPGPTDVQYFGIVRLHPSDVAALAVTYPSAATSRPPQIPPELASFVPASMAWQRSTGYPTMVAGRAVVMYLEPAQALVFFVLSTM